MQNQILKPLAIFGMIVGLSLIISAGIGASAFYKIKALDNVLSVTGSAKKEIESDQARWIVSLNRTVYQSGVKEGYRVMNSDLAAVKQFFKENDVAESDLVITPVFMDQFYDYSNNNGTQTEKQYTLRQTIEMNSSDVAKITALANKISQLIDRGVLASTQSLEYYYSKLPELRVQLLADALKDAKERADVLAKSGGKKVGTLRSSTSGVVQVLPTNSVEVSDYGAYDTSSIKKEVMVTVKAAFGLE